MNHKRCRTLQFLITFLSATSIMTIVAAVYLSQFPDYIRPAMGIMMAVVYLGTLVLNLFANWQIFRWFNTERAIAKTLEDGTAFQENLLPDVIFRLSGTAAFAAGMGSVMNLLRHSPEIFRGFFIAAIVVQLATLIFAAYLIIRTLSWRVERAGEDDRRILISEHGTNRVMSRITLAKHHYKYSN